MTGLDSECVVSCPAHQLLHLLILMGFEASPVLWEYHLVIHTFGISLFSSMSLLQGPKSQGKITWQHNFKNYFIDVCLCRVEVGWRKVLDLLDPELRAVIFADGHGCTHSL